MHGIFFKLHDYMLNLLFQAVRRLISEIVVMEKVSHSRPLTFILKGCTTDLRA